jgi:hypothetical protein
MVRNNGDSGAFVVNSSIEVVGLLLGAPKSMKLTSLDAEGEDFSQANFIEIYESWRWCS